MRTEGIGRIWGTALFFAVGLCAAACGESQSGVPDSPTTAGGAESTEQVHVYWADVDENKNLVTREKVITQEQKQALLAARNANREAGRRGVVRATIGSTDWQNACQYYGWILLTSGADGAGDIFCATYVDGSVTPRAANIPFMPAWYDGSHDYYSLLCTGGDYCRFSDDCGFWGRDVYATLGKFGGGNLAPGPARWIREYPDCPFSGW